MLNRVFLLMSLCVLSLATTNSHALDIVHVNKRHSVQDTRTVYPHAVLHKALDVSSERYGPFKVTVNEFVLPNNRTIDLLEHGEILNVVMVVTSTEWESRTIPIRIPLRMGALAYRVLVVNEHSLAKFEQVTDLQSLKALTVGLHRNWVTWNIMTDLGFDVGSGYSYESLFGMLSKRRFDYLPRGVHEVYDELKIRHKRYPGIVIEPKLALYIPSPFYMFVSPKHPRIAERLTFGLEKMVKDGTLKSMFLAHYGDTYKQANLKNRTIIDIGNPLLPKETPLDREELWLDFLAL